jgi:membrane protease YdiL (CAAX protease family)
MQVRNTAEKLRAFLHLPLAGVTGFLLVLAADAAYTMLFDFTRSLYSTITAHICCNLCIYCLITAPDYGLPYRLS